MIDRKRVLEIAKNNMMQYVHETNLVRFSEQIVEECRRCLELNGYDDAGRVLTKESIK
jgi:hypothetical protein